MFERARNWYRNLPQNQRRGLRPRTILTLEWLERRLLLAGDTYAWNPLNPANDTSASNPANWEKNSVQQNANGTLPGQGGQSPNDVVELYAGPGFNNSDIDWNRSFTFSKLILGLGYSGTETIGPLGVTLDLTGVADGTALSADGVNSGKLIVQFADAAGHFQIDGNANIAAFSFKPSVVGKTSGTVIVDGGTTTICTGNININSLLNGTLEIRGLAAVEDKGKTQLILDGKNTTIVVGNNALFQVDGGAGNTLISESVAGNNNYIDVQSGGYLSYVGAGVTDTFTAPVWIEQGGTMKLSGGGSLSITGAEQGTHNVSLYLEGSFQSKNGTNLKPGKGMTATSTSNVATLDSNTATITVDSGNPCEMDGFVNIDTTSGTYGDLVVDCDTLVFGGTLVAHVSGPSSGTNDELIVNGVLDLTNTSQLDTPLDGTGSMGDTWTVVSASGGIEGQFAYFFPVNNLYWQQNSDTDTVYYYG